jgi:uncharacterized protein (DUF849 family)
VRHKGVPFALLTFTFNALFYAIATKWHNITGGDDGLSIRLPDINLGFVHLQTGDIITAALTGSIHTPSMSPYLPVTPEKLIEEAVAVYNAGGAVAHVHVRDPETGMPNADQDIYRQIAAEVKKRCDIILCFTTGGKLGEPVENRVRVASNLKPELEIYDAGMINNVAFLIDKGVIKTPVYLQFVMGILGGIPATIENFVFLLEMARKQSGNFEFSVCAAGKQQFPMCTASLLMGGHARVGLEDNLYLEKGVLAKSSAEQVAKLIRIAGEFGIEPATPEEARKILHLKGLDKVNY